MSTATHLIRFVVDGLRDTIASFAAGTLPLHRLAWELQSRLDSLADLVGRRALTPLRSSQFAVTAIDTSVRESGRTTTTAREARLLANALASIRTELDRLTAPALEPIHATPARAA